MTAAIITGIVLVAVFGGLGTILFIQERRRLARYEQLSRTSQMAVVNGELEAERARNQTVAEAYAGPRVGPTSGYMGPF
ncbi:hypothetical protein ACWGJ9_09140 [Curtobacterium citreum]